MALLLLHRVSLPLWKECFIMLLEMKPSTSLGRILPPKYLTI